VDCYDKVIKCLDDNGERRILQGKKNPSSMRMVIVSVILCILSPVIK